MSLFSKEKKYTPDEILDLINALPEDERAKLKAKFDDLYKAEDEREIDKIEEDKTDSPETADEKAEEVKEESEEIGKDVDEIEDKGTEELEEEGEMPEAPEAPEEPEQAEEDEELDNSEQDNSAEIIQGLTDRLTALEATVAKLAELKNKMEEYTAKQADRFGYRSGAAESRKPYEDMSADELKHHILYN